MSKGPAVTVCWGRGINKPGVSLADDFAARPELQESRHLLGHPENYLFLL